METWRVFFEKDELANMSKEDLQERLNKLIEVGLIPSNVTIDDVGSYESEQPLLVVDKSKAVLIGCSSVAKNPILIKWE